MPKYEWKNFADKSLEEIKEFINTESQLIKKEHKLISAVLHLDYIFAHLDELIPARRKDLHKLSGEICSILVEIKDLIEEGELKELRFKKEEIKLLELLEQKVEHRDWRAVKSVIDLEKDLELEVLRLQLNEIKLLHSKFIQLMRLIKKSSLEKEDKRIRYYFSEIYKIAAAYERIFRHLWKKERILNKKLGTV